MCAFRMGVSKESIEGKPVAPNGIYELKLTGFAPKFSKPKANEPDKAPSLNLNARLEIVNNPDYEGKVGAVFMGLNLGFAPALLDFCHGLGYPMETDGEEYWLPGKWDTTSDFDPTKAETYKYEGPLTGRILKAELTTDTYNGREKNVVTRIFCAVDDCATKFPEIRHSENLNFKKS